MPDNWERGRLRKTLALLGAATAATPAALWAGTSIANNKGITTGWPFRTNVDTTGDLHNLAEVYPDVYPGGTYKKALESWMSRSSDTGLDSLPPIDVDELGRVIWGDPTTSSILNDRLKTTTSVAMAAAQSMPGGQGPGLVTPSQMGRLAAGMGAGYMSGALVGGALGVLTGMPRETQDVMKRTGMYAGVVQEVMPRLFGL